MRRHFQPALEFAGMSTIQFSLALAGSYLKDCQHRHLKLFEYNFKLSQDYIRVHLASESLENRVTNFEYAVDLIEILCVQLLHQTLANKENYNVYTQEVNQASYRETLG